MVLGNLVNVAVKGIGAINFTEIDTGLVINTATGSELAILDNNEVARIPFSDNGVRLLGEEFIRQKDETLTITRDTYSGYEMSWRAFRRLRLDNNVTLTVPLAFEPIQVDNNAPKADTENTLFYVALDQPSTGSVLKNHLSFPLTQQPFASFDPAIPDSFAVGAQGAFKFSTSTLRSSVSLNVPITLPQVTSLVEGSIPQYSVEATFVTSKEELVHISIPRVSLSVEGTGVQPFESPREQSFKIIRVPGQCASYSITLLQTKVGC